MVECREALEVFALLNDEAVGFGTLDADVLVFDESGAEICSDTVSLSQVFSSSVISSESRSPSSVNWSGVKIFRFTGKIPDFQKPFSATS